MERLLISRLALLAAILPSLACAELQLNAGFDVGIVDGGPLPSFQDGSMGKLRYGKHDDGLQLLNGYLQVQSDVQAVWDGKIVLDVNSQADNPVGVSEAVLQFRPLPVGGVRFRAKLGAFRPPISFEHGANGWETLYTTNASAINSWAGEELGGVGLEVVAKRDLASSGSNSYWSAGGALFYGNDPAGTLLSWRGWSINNWQTRWGGDVKLAELPVFQFAPDQDHASEPFLELDNRPGFYLWGEIGNAGRFRSRVLYYDNRADMDASGHGQSGWRTRFWSLSAQLALPWDFGLIGQWMDGSTYFGPVRDGRRVLDNHFDAYFLLLTRTLGSHRFSARHDWFGVDDENFSPIDPNNEDGTAWTLSYQYRLNENWLFGVEWIEIDSTRPARVFAAEPIALTERGWFLVSRWRL